jgi:hypothetical protein
MADSMADRRDWPRYALTLVAEVFEPLNSTVLNARSSDVSRSGCYIDTLSPLPPQTRIRIQLRSGDDVLKRKHASSTSVQGWAWAFIGGPTRPKTISRSWMAAKGRYALRLETWKSDSGTRASSS